MKLRWKLLLVLMTLSAIPLFTLNFTARKTGHEMIRDMTDRSREVLIARAKADLLRRMVNHAQIVSREKQIINLALKTQRGRLRQILEGKEKEIRRLKNKGLRESQKHFCLQPDGSRRSLKINPGKVRIGLLENATIDRFQAKSVFRPMLRSFQKLERSNPEQVYWQIIRLTNGAVATYPFYIPCAPDKTHLKWIEQQEKSSPGWYREAQLTDKSVFWTPPYKDPVTGKLIMSAVAKIQEYKGKFHGAMMVMVPLGSVLSNDIDDTTLSTDATSLLAHVGTTPAGQTGLRLIAEEHHGKSTSTTQGGWMVGKDDSWLTGDEKKIKDMTHALTSGKSGMTRMKYKGKDSLWFYAPIKLSRSSLILIVPMESIIGTTVKTETYLKDKIENQFTTIFTLIWGMTLVVLIASLILSKTMTKRISDIAQAFNTLAKGDFSTRINVKGRDELSDLGHAFNDLAPALEEQVRIKEALTIAQEVQRSLLPDKAPQVTGLDVAGMSMYCEDTGGDYFDYPHLGIEADELGLAVGDVSGHGVPAALLMTTARALLRQRAQHGGSLGSVVEDANNMLADDVRLSGRFMTLFLFAIDLKTHSARWVRAGHDPALVYLPSTDSFSELGGDTGLPLGVDGDWDYVEEHADLEDGSVILIGTDGIWEAVNPQGTMYGKERLNTILQEHAARSAQEILDIILQSLKDFTAEAGFEDDVTLAVVKVLEQ